MEKFYAECLDNLQEVHEDIKKSIDGLPPEALDWSPKEGVNSITALIVHLTGSQRFLYMEVLSGENINRDRDAEFRARGLGPEELAKRLDDNIQMMSGILEKFSSLADLDSICKFRTRDTTVGWVIGHSIKHTASHLGHIQVMRDLWKVFNT